ncbi:GIY-YIG nuclease family protein [Vibrio owensii]|uniref:GIY-YIG nuclease family protein n=1 Tax=Vibrio owensii TaxID=696485 RepID=UPI00215C7C00|nr:GIY-YIG nuclease family protein [Vibrio owensii]MCR9941749.1 GIY-YIG nuclease family protein [Vibrio owensii]
MTQKEKGYVYILEVKDIDLPVCKIGKTTRHPDTRCLEINRNSTGDFKWSVFSYKAVDDCNGFESLIHNKLAPLRQKGREFFNLTPENALKAITSIFQNQRDIHEISSDSINVERAKAKDEGKKESDIGNDELFRAFESKLDLSARRFGQKNKPVYGVSDGNRGVQWNLSVSKINDQICLGVNLEGMKYINWPISTFIQNELRSPSIQNVIKDIDGANEIFICFTRDAWQVTSRPEIVEKYIGKRAYTFSELNTDVWEALLAESLECLDKTSKYRGRAVQSVTLVDKNGKETEREMGVSPHLTIWLEINPESPLANLNEGFERLRSVYEWVSSKSCSDG